MIGENEKEFQVPIDQVVASKTNPRKRYDTDEMQQLIDSIAANGILQPVLVRPANEGKRYELVAGERRVRAARALKLSTVPAFVRKLSDEQVLEVQIVENLQRADLHPLEEAAGYQKLFKRTGYTVEKIATQIGRSVKYIYDRMKLTELTDDVKSLFWKGHIEAGHAILLARLDPKDQARAIVKEGGGLFQSQRLLYEPDDPVADADEQYKAVSVRELQGWIDEHVKFQPARDADPMLFPEAAEAVAAGHRLLVGIVPVTYDHYVKEDARDGEKVVGPRSWKRSDGQRGSKPCDHSLIGMIVVGPGRGASFPVCVAKKKCTVHWREEQRQSKRRAKERAAGKKPTGGQQPQEAERERYKREVKRFERATPEIRKALAERVRKAPTKSGGLLASILAKRVLCYGQKAPTLVSAGRTAEDLVRHLAFAVLDGQLSEWRAAKEFPKRARALGLDVRPLIKAANPPEKKVQTSAPRKTKRKKE